MRLSLVQTLYRAKGSSEFAQISIHHPPRRCRRRSNLVARPSRCALCTNTSFTFLGSPSPLLRFHMQHSFLQALYWEIGSSEFAQISIHGPIQHCRRRSCLEARPCRYAFGTNPNFTFVGSPSSLLPFHMHLSSVQTLYREIGISEFAQISIHGPMRR